MFNHIRHVPYIQGDGKGGIQYFAGGFQSQWGMETQIVAGMCKSLPQKSTHHKEQKAMTDYFATDAILAFATISLALKVPRMVDAKRQQAAVLVWSILMFAMYSFLLSVFRIKNGGYPFWLPPF